MGEPTTEENKSPETTPAAAELKKLDAAKAVCRPVAEKDKDGLPTGKTKSVPVRAEEVLAYSVKDGRVVVVTTDGQKLEGKL